MFRAKLDRLADGSLLKMEGRLVGEWADEAKTLVLQGPAPKRLIVDLSEVSYVDAVGEQVLGMIFPAFMVQIDNDVYSRLACC